MPNLTIPRMQKIAKSLKAAKANAMKLEAERLKAEDVELVDLLSAKFKTSRMQAYDCHKLHSAKNRIGADDYEGYLIKSLVNIEYQYISNCDTLIRATTHHIKKVTGTDTQSKWLSAPGQLGAIFRSMAANDRTLAQERINESWTISRYLLKSFRELQLSGRWELDRLATSINVFGIDYVINECRYSVIRGSVSENNTGVVYKIECANGGWHEVSMGDHSSIIDEVNELINSVNQIK